MKVNYPSPTTVNLFICILNERPTHIPWNDIKKANYDCEFILEGGFLRILSFEIVFKCRMEKYKFLNDHESRPSP